MAKEKVSITLAVQSDFSAVENDLKQLQGKMAGLGLPGLETKDFSYRLEELRKKVESFQQLNGREITVKSDFSEIQRDLDRTDREAEDLLATIRNLQAQTEAKKLSLLPEDEQRRIEAATKAVKGYAKEAKKLADQEARIRELEAEKDSQITAKKNLSQEASFAAATFERYFKKRGTPITAPTTLADAEAFLAEQEKMEQSATKAYSAKNWRLGEGGAAYDNNKLAKRGVLPLKQARENLAAAQAYVEALRAVDNATKDITTTENKLNSAQATLANTTRVDVSVAYSDLRQIAQNLGIQVDDLSDNFNEVDATELQKRLESLKTNGLQQVDQGLTEITQGLNNVRPAMDQTGVAVEQNKRKYDELAESISFANMQAREIDSLKNHLLSFFSISGVINTFSNAIRSAFETVKELDSAMTEIAVVSDFSVNDMWKQLPRFTDQANQLGMAISDTYEATTLFVQQGLDLDSSMSLATETLKMAAVAGMDAAAATDSMTSALRGFDMALDETSAQRVNDVYSELAA